MKEIMLKNSQKSISIPEYIAHQNNFTYTGIINAVSDLLSLHYQEELYATLYRTLI